MKFSTFINYLSTNLIPPKFEIGQNFQFEIHVQNAISLSILNGIPTNQGSKFKLDCLELKNSYILLIDVFILSYG